MRPIFVTFIAGLVAPASVSLVGFLMFGNLIRECGALTSLSETAQNSLANLITLLLGITISFSMRAEQFVTLQTVMIMALGLFAFVFDTVGGVLFAKVLNIFSKKKMTEQWVQPESPHSQCTVLLRSSAYRRTAPTIF